jgi:hypothetical protein
MIKAKVTLLLTALLATTLFPSTAHARGLLVLVGHSVNIQTLTGTSLESGEGVLVRATSQGDLKILGYSPAP